MESLYVKYTILKSKRDSEFEQLNLDQEEKFKTYVSEADALINYLLSEKDKLHEEIGNLREEVSSIRDAKDQEQEKYEKIIIEENQKNKELLEEIERLHKTGIHSSSSDDLPAIEHVSGRTKTSTNRKRRRNGVNEVEVSPSVGGQHDHTLHTRLHPDGVATLSHSLIGELTSMDTLPNLIREAQTN